MRLRFLLGPDDRRIIMFDSDDGEWWRVEEARRGHHGPQGASRRRTRSPAERVRARPEVALMINRGRDGMVNAGAVSEGAAVFSEITSSAVQPHGGDRSHRHRILTALDVLFGFTSCARPKLGLRAGAATPHRNRAYGHGTSPQRGCCSPVRYLDRRPQAQGAPNTTARPRWSGRTGRWR